MHFPAEESALQQQRNFLPRCRIWQLFKSKLTLSKIDQKINISAQMERSHSGSGLLSPNLELSWDTRPTQLLSQRLPQWSVDILHGRTSINSSVQIYTKQINCCNHIIKSFQKKLFSYLKGNLKTFKPKIKHPYISRACILRV